jgi:pimeloyl-ACP methyl ester carboxylesterase
VTTATGERIIQRGGVDLCVEAFGDPGNDAVLLIHGASASMLWWEEALCARIAAGGRYVIRFDNRDTGRSSHWPPGRPGYGIGDMAGDAVGILDAFAVTRAHVVGRSMAGAIAPLVAARDAGRMASLTLVSTTPGGPGLSPMAEGVVQYTSCAAPDPADPASVIAFIVGLMRVYAGGSPHFDEAATRALAERDVARTANVASCLLNHFVIAFDDAVAPAQITVPTLVVHGDRDPVFGLDHGRALRRAIPRAELLVLPDTGHAVPPPVWDRFVAALLRHTAAA